MLGALCHNDVPLARLATLAIATLSTLLLTTTTAQDVSPSYTSDDDFQTACLNSTNTFRTQHNATDLSWNTSLASSSSSLASACEFEHSGGPNGENIASGYPNVTATIEAWGVEREDYDFPDGGFDEETGHFTQLVWKNTTSVGCAREECAEMGWFVVCQYWPPGNVEGAYEEEVEKRVDEEGAASALGARRGLWKTLGVVVMVLLCTGSIPRI